MNGSNSCNVSLTPEQRNEILLANGITGAFSVVSCLFAVLLVLILALYKDFIYRLAMYQVLASLFHALSMVSVLLLYNYDRDTKHNICVATAFIMLYAEWVKLMFTSWLTFHLFSYVVFFKNFKKLEWLYISSSVLFPLLFVWVPFIHHSFGMSGAWCYIRSWDENDTTQPYRAGIIEQYVLFFGPATLLLVLNIVGVLYVIFVMFSRCSNDDDEATPLLDHSYSVSALKKLLPHLAYPIIYFVIVMFSLITRLLMAVSSCISFYVFFTQAVEQSCMGFFAGLALVLHVRMSISSKLREGNSRIQTVYMYK